MLDDLKFVQGAVAKKDYMPALTHFHIAGGRIKGYNGSLALCSPIDLDLDVRPKALPFARAIQTCRDTVQLNMTPKGRLAVRSGAFKAYIECTEDPFPEVEPEGQKIEIDGELLLKVMTTLEPFVAEDASRPWARGVLLRGTQAVATNNVVLVEYNLGTPFPVEVNVPHTAIKELLRIKLPPVAIRVCQDNLTFQFEGGRWLRAQTYSTQWPDYQRILEGADNPMVPPPPALFQALEDLMPFADKLERVYFHSEGVGTAPAGCEEGAFIKVPDLKAEGCYNGRYLLSLSNTIKTVDLTAYPKPSRFSGDGVRGAIIGMLQQ